MKKGTKVWFITSNLTNSIGIVDSYAGEGFYWVRSVEKGSLHYVRLNEMNLFYQPMAVASKQSLLEKAILRMSKQKKLVHI
jgi:hypothetical protein